MADERLRPTHTLIAWGPAIAGAVIALAVSQLLAILGTAIGATLLNPFDASRGDLGGFTVGGGLWTAFSYFIALQIGAFVATRASPLDDGHRGLMQGALVWALVFAVAVLIAGFGLSLGVTGFLDHRAAMPMPVMVDPDMEGSEAAAAIEAAADATAALAWWAFATLAFSLAGALVGGHMGEQKAFWDYWTPAAKQPPITPT